VLALTAGPTASAETHRYVIDPTASRVSIRVGKTGLFGFAGHEHEVAAPLRRGTATVDPDHLESSALELAFDAGALRVTGRGEPAADVPKVQAAMVGPECLDAGRFSTIKFVSSAVMSMGGAAKGSVDLSVRGTLSLHGFARALTVPVHVVFEKDALTATGTTSFRQSEFGIKPISVAGVVKVKDEVSVTWHFVARLSP